MRGFIFTVDMAFAAAGVILLLAILMQSSVPEHSIDSLDYLRVKDATMEWFYTGVVPVFPSPAPDQYMCDTGYRPRVTTDWLDPSSDADWVVQEVCLEVFS